MSNFQRIIPTSMATQHPDNAGAPYWNKRSFISTSNEIKECYLCFSDMDIDEYNWDWEGKFVDEAVIDRLLHKYYQYFKRNPLGNKKYLTFRIPNPRVEKHFRLGRAFMVMVTSSQLAQSLGFSDAPIFETILPLTETAQEVIEIQKAFRDLISIDNRLLKMEDSIRHIEIIPLFEQVDKIIESANLLKRYILLHKKSFGYLPTYIRPYCARSDPALNSGLVPTMLAISVALSDYHHLSKETGVKLFPMVGTGSLPFRGGVTPDNIDKAINAYAGFSTLIIQSAFRYDYQKSTVIKAIAALKDQLPKRMAKVIKPELIENIKQLIPSFENPYRRSIEKIAPLINLLSSQVARRRERVLHIGLFGYSRGIGQIKLPRAIPFTASLYSLGIPPELIGTGRGLKRAKKQKLWQKVAGVYQYFKEDVQSAGYYVNKDNLLSLAKKDSFWYDILDDIGILERELGFEMGPKESSHYEHKKISSKIYQRICENKEATQLITEGGIIRKSLG